MTSDEERDPRERAASALENTADDLAEVARKLNRSAEVARDQRRQQRLRLLGEAVVAQMEAIRARVSRIRSTGAGPGTEAPGEPPTPPAGD